MQRALLPVPKCTGETGAACEVHPDFRPPHVGAELNIRACPLVVEAKGHGEQVNRGRVHRAKTSDESMKTTFGIYTVSLQYQRPPTLSARKHIYHLSARPLHRLQVLVPLGNTGRPDPIYLFEGLTWALQLLL